MYLKKEIIISIFYNNYICFKSLYAHDMVICFSAGFSYSVLMWPRFAVQAVKNWSMVKYAGVEFANISSQLETRAWCQ